MKKLCLLICALMLLSLALTACGVKVSFDIGDATLLAGELEQKYKEDAPVVAPTVEKEGYFFAGWDKDFSAPTEELIVSPVWKKIHTVSFEIADATAEDASLLVQKIVDGEGATEPKVTRAGYVFVGWDGDFSEITGDMTVTATWKKLHTVTYQLVGGKTTDEKLLVQQVEDGEGAKAPTVTRDRYEFVKWDTDFSKVTEDITVTAVWERKTYSSTEIFELVNPATVEITTYRANDMKYGMGSGFFIDKEGTLLTNFHVVKNARRITVTTHDGKTYPVTRVISYDVEKDIAVLQVGEASGEFAYLEIATELPKAGEAVWALGSSLGLTGTFSSGIVSYVNREVDGVKFIQTTTPISQGNSGGPLVNEQGYVVGINSASYTKGQNLNLAVEISQYKTLAKLNITPEALFNREATLRYWIGEKVIMESKTAEYTGQFVSDGTTIHGYHDGGKFYDYYLVPCAPKDSVLLIMVKADKKQALKDISNYLRPLVADTDITADGMWLSADCYIPVGITEENGESYYIAMIGVPAEFSELAEHIGVAVASDVASNYELFMYYITEEMANDLIG